MTTTATSPDNNATPDVDGRRGEARGEPGADGAAAADTRHASSAPPACGGRRGAARGEPGAGGAAAADPGLRPVRRFWWWLAGITAAALAVRLTYLLGWRAPWTPIGDPWYYHRGANLLADGEGYVHPYQYLLFDVRHPGADHPPAFLTFLAGFSWL